MVLSFLEVCIILLCIILLVCVIFVCLYSFYNFIIIYYLIKKKLYIKLIIMIHFAEIKQI